MGHENDMLAEPMDGAEARLAAALEDIQHYLLLRNRLRDKLIAAGFAEDKKRKLGMVEPMLDALIVAHSDARQLADDAIVSASSNDEEAHGLRVQLRRIQQVELNNWSAADPPAPGFDEGWRDGYEGKPAPESSTGGYRQGHEWGAKRRAEL